MEPGPTGRGAIRELAPYEPGRPAAAVRRELGVEQVVKLASNEGAYGPFPAALEAIAAAASDLNRYPERTYELRELLAERHGVPIERIALGNGADGLINNISLAYLDAGDEAACCWPSFVSYRLSTLKTGGVPVTAPLRGGGYDLEALAERIGPRTRLVHVCNPNNPTGGIVGRDELARFFDAVPERVLVVVDQAYHEYVTDPDYADAAAEHGHRPNVCVLRTFSKIYGLAGLRIGYAVAAPEVCAEIGKVRNAFDVNELALVAAAASIGRHEQIAERRAETLSERARLGEGLERLGLIPLASHGNFVCVPVPDGQALASRLEEEGVIVRPLGAFGAPDAVRVTVGTPRENGIFLEALGRVLTRMSRRSNDIETLREGVLAGEKRAVARAISLVENRDELAYELVRQLYAGTGNAIVAGLTGPPGVGKSSLIATLVGHLRQDGRSIGVVSVDPSSPFSHGAVLGDRIRLVDHFLDPEVFIRSMSTRGYLGGVSEATLQALLILDAAGKDVLLLETVGVGQSEVEVASIADTVVLVLMPGSGDSIQALKAGVMEIPDVIVINKADHPATRTMRSEIRSVLSLGGEREWKPPIVETEAISGRGVDELWQAILSHRAHLDVGDGLAERRRRSLEHEVVAVAVSQVRRRLMDAIENDPQVRALLDQVHERKLDPLTATREIADRVFGTM